MSFVLHTTLMWTAPVFTGETDIFRELRIRKCYIVYALGCVLVKNTDPVPLCTLHCVALRTVSQQNFLHCGAEKLCFLLCILKGCRNWVCRWTKTKHSTRGECSTKHLVCQFDTKMITLSEVGQYTSSNCSVWVRNVKILASMYLSIESDLRRAQKSRLFLFT